MAAGRPARRSVLSSPARFARGCVSVSLGLVVLVLAGLVDGELAYPLAALVLAVGGLAALIPVEERQHQLRTGTTGRPSGRAGTAAASDPAPVRPAETASAGPATAAEPLPATVPPAPALPAPTPLPPAPPLLPAVPSPAPDRPTSESVGADGAPDADVVVHTFRLPAAAGAERAWVVGEFNGWSHTAHPMQHEDGDLVARIPLERGRAYRFRYRLDGDRWENDWTADRYVPNEFGGDDSVILT